MVVYLLCVYTSATGFTHACVKSFLGLIPIDDEYDGRYAMIWRILNPECARLAT